ncbi:MAG: ATP-binding cassette domain-containing protein [Desulfobacterales bacterium]
MGLVSEDHWIFPGLTVLQNRQLGVMGKKTKGRRIIEDVFKMFPRLGERSNVHGGLISGGEQQMLNICHILMGDPNFIMIGEPTDDLAPKLVEQVGKLIEEIAQHGISVLLLNRSSTHY